jgi:uncharacterized protein GlcG (DUF336 family)
MNETTPIASFTGAITLPVAQQGSAAGTATAESLDVAVSLAVVDAGGVLKAFADGPCRDRG